MKHEEFCLQIDAHSDFAPEWDMLLTRAWGGANNEYAILSSVPTDISVLDREDLNSDNQQVPHLCQAKVDKRGMIVSLPPTLARSLPRPILAPLWNSGYSFSKCHAEYNVPVDPNLQVIFEADEFVRYARFWTNGYDVYTPSKLIVFHDYFGKMFQSTQVANNYNFMSMEWVQKCGMTPQFIRKIYDRTAERIATVLGFSEGGKDVKALSLLTKYGLGTKRTLDQLIEFTGIDIRNKVIYADRCKQLEWVPYEAEYDPEVLSGDPWGTSSERFQAGGQNIPLLIGAQSGDVDLFPLEVFQNAYEDAVGGDSTTNTNSIGNENGVGRVSKIMADIKQEEKLLQDGLGRLIKDGEWEIAQLVAHRGKELWWLFQPLDTALESVMNRIDMEVGMGMGSKVMKVFLLLVPLIALLMIVAYWTLYGNNSSLIELMYSLNEWIKANSTGTGNGSSSGGKGGNSFFSPSKRFKADATKII